MSDRDSFEAPTPPGAIRTRRLHLAHLVRDCGNSIFGVGAATSTLWLMHIMYRRVSFGHQLRASSRLCTSYILGWTVSTNLGLYWAHTEVARAEMETGTTLRQAFSRLCSTPVSETHPRHSTDEHQKAEEPLRGDLALLKSAYSKLVENSETQEGKEECLDSGRTGSHGEHEATPKYYWGVGLIRDDKTILAHPNKHNLEACFFACGMVGLLQYSYPW
ncbi:hypothetical protein F4778DRAFT_760048 [Xylariomycetidae sp. FL2044]|nr:hypothetical protein F4778DRAFT_760048 [Xylariomycetidae sp. FL2044]